MFYPEELIRGIPNDQFLDEDGISAQLIHFKIDKESNRDDDLNL